MSTPYAIKGRLVLQLYFNDIEFPFSASSPLGFLHISSSSRIDVPMVYGKITDGSEFFKTIASAMVEGTVLKVVMQPLQSTVKVYTFRINSLRTQKSPDGAIVTFDGYLDFPKYWVSATQRVFLNKTTHEVIKEICADCDIGYIGTPTNDHQNWYGSNKRYHEIVRDLANSGYKDDSGCMARALGTDGNLAYVDVTDMSDVAADFSMGEYIPGKVPIVSFLPYNAGGAMNKHSGYKSEYLQQSPNLSQVFAVQQAVATDLEEGGFLNMNKEVQAVMEKGLNRISPIDYGNVNQTFHRSQYQNSRIRNLFTQGIDVVTNYPTDNLWPLDTVRVTGPAEAYEYTGIYKIISHTIMIQNDDYHEKFELRRRTIIAEGPLQAQLLMKTTTALTSLLQPAADYLSGFLADLQSKLAAAYAAAAAGAMDVLNATAVAVLAQLAADVLAITKAGNAGGGGGGVTPNAPESLVAFRLTHESGVSSWKISNSVFYATTIGAEYAFGLGGSTMSDIAASLLNAGFTVTHIAEFVRTTSSSSFAEGSGNQDLTGDLGERTWIYTMKTVMPITGKPGPTGQAGDIVVISGGGNVSSTINSALDQIKASEADAAKLAAEAKAKFEAANKGAGTGNLNNPLG